MRQLISRDEHGAPRLAAAEGRALVLVNLLPPGPIREHDTQWDTMTSFIKYIFLKKLLD